MDSVSTLDLMSWVIAGCNVASALLVGPALALVIKRRPGWLVWVILGWFLLAVGQVTFVLFGFKSGYPGFKYLQVGMIPIAAANFAASIYLRQRQEFARAEIAPDSGRHYISHAENLARAAEKQVGLGATASGTCDSGSCRHTKHTPEFGYAPGSGWETRS